MTRNIVFLSLAALLLIGISLNATREVEQQGVLNYSALVPGLKERLNEVDRITISKQDVTLTLQRDDAGIWRVQEHYDYPAAAAEIRKMLLYLSQSEIRDKKTANPERLSRLGLADSQAHHVTLYNGDDAQYHIMLGNMANDGGATYVRLGNNPQSYAASGQLTFTAQPSDWLEYGLFTIEPTRVQRISYQLDGKKSYDYSRSSPKEDMTLSPLREGRKIANRYSTVSPANYFARLSFEEVLPADDNMAKAGYVELITFDGLVLRFTLVEADSRYYVMITANADKTHYVQDVAGQNFTTTQQEADAINTRTNGWVYLLGQFQMNQLTLSYFDIVEDVQ